MNVNEIDSLTKQLQVYITCLKYLHSYSRQNMTKSSLPHSDSKIKAYFQKDDLLTRFISCVFAQML